MGLRLHSQDRTGKIYCADVRGGCIDNRDCHSKLSGGITTVALPLMKEGMSKKKAFIIGSMTAVVEPIFAVLAAIFAGMTQSSISVFLAFAAGTMIYVVVEELIPEAHMDGNKRKAKRGHLDLS